MPLSSNVSNRPGRGTVDKIYGQLTEDLSTAIDLLPISAGLPTRPSRTAGYALLAKVYLNMQQYAEAASIADKCLEINNKLLDYNTLDPSSGAPMPAGIQNKNPEIIFYTTSLYGFYYLPSTEIATELVNGYEPNDLRRNVFLESNGTGYNFKGSYTGDLFSYGLFAGIATDEIYLIRAEANIRSQKIPEALRDLNLLLFNRYKSGTFVPISGTNPEPVLRKILTERRKELVARGIRWSDLRRLNQDSRFAVTLKRNIGGTEYTLAPNSLRYLFPIPDNEINSSGIAQNPR